jgi:aspartyl-tRNA(Asn)/glutamyl-tRNA(Gln) amidotransferase subunit A
MCDYGGATGDIRTARQRPRALLGDSVEPGVGTRSVRTPRLQQAGATLADVRSLALAIPVSLPGVNAERAPGLARHDGVRYSTPATRRSRGLLPHAGCFGAEAKRRIMIGTFVLSAGIARRLLRQGTAGAGAHSGGL